MSRAPTFEQLSMRAAEKFLQTALLLDDQAFPPEQQEELPIELDTPQPFEIEEDDEDLSAAEISEATGQNNWINAENIIRGFADLGIVCAVLDPRGCAENWAALHPDITILDWYMGDETGERARQLLGDQICRERADHPHQVRLVLVYTMEPDLLDIREKLGELLKSFEGELPKEVGKTGLSWEGWRLVVLAKENASVAGDLISSVVTDADLPQRAVAEFSEIARGLLPHVALAGLAAIRRNTHRILRRFSSSLDPAYLTHGALLPEPSDAGEQLISLFGSELAAVLEDERVADISDSAAIRAWIGARDLTYPLKVKCDGDNVELSGKRQVGDLLSKGVYSHSRVKDLDQDGVAQEALVKRFRTQLTALLGGDSKAGDAAFSELMSFRPHYGSVPPKLTLGTVVLNPASNSYWLCVQPKCDSVRLDSSQPFLFMPLKEASSFDICMPQGTANPLKLKRERKAHFLKAYRFAPDETGVVRAENRDGRLDFMTSGRVPLRFVGQLRDDVAQDVAHRIATRLSRVGVDVSEWQRRSLPRAIRDQ